MKSAFENADTAIMIVTAGSPTSTDMLNIMRSPGTLSSTASALFESMWRAFELKFAKDGGVFGALIHGRLHAVGPVIMMGRRREVALIAEILTLRARELTRRSLTPIIMDEDIEATVATVVAELSEVEGSA
jgi:hypothetical protein